MNTLVNDDLFSYESLMKRYAHIESTDGTLFAKLVKVQHDQCYYDFYDLTGIEQLELLKAYVSAKYDNFASEFLASDILLMLFPGGIEDGVDFDLPISLQNFVDGALGLFEYHIAILNYEPIDYPDSQFHSEFEENKYFDNKNDREIT